MRDDPRGLDCGGLGRKIVVKRPVRSAMTSCACSQPLTLYFQNTDIGYDAFAQPVTGVVTECQADRKASLQDEIETRF